MKRLLFLAFPVVMLMACAPQDNDAERIEQALQGQQQRILDMAGITDTLFFDTIKVVKVERISQPQMVVMKTERYETRNKVLATSLETKKKRLENYGAEGEEVDSAKVAETQARIADIEQQLAHNKHQLDSLNKLLEGNLDAEKVLYYKAYVRLAISDVENETRSLNAQMILTPQLQLIKPTDMK